MILNIKSAVRAQAKEIDKVIASCLAPECEKIKSYGENYAENCIDSSLLTATVTCDKTVRGVCVCESSPVPDGCEITALYIEDGYQGKGLGRKLLSHCLREMRALRMKTVFLWVDERSTRAADFFKAIGFRHDGKRRRMLGIDEDYSELRYRIDI